MKPTQIAELFANIKATIVSFFSILMFAALGVGIFAGIYWMAPSLQSSVEEAFDGGDFHHFQIQYPYGLTQDDLAKLKDVEGVADVEEGYVSFATFEKDSQNYTVKLQSLGARMDVPNLVQGELPTKPNEIAMNVPAADELGISVGDTLVLAHDTSSESDEDGLEQLKTDVLTVTGLAESPEYLAVSPQTFGFSPTGSGSVDTVAWAPAATFDSKAYQDGFPLVNVRCTSLEGMRTFAAEYESASDAQGELISNLGSQLAPVRFDELHDKAQQQVEDAEKQLNDAKKQISDGEKKVEEGEAQLKQARIDLDAAVADGEARLAEAYQTLQNGEAQKVKAEKKLSSARSQLDTAQKAVDALDAAKNEARAAVKEMKAFKSKQDKALKAGKITQAKYDANLDKSGAAQRKRLNAIAKKAGVSIPKINHSNYAQVISTIQEALDTVESATITVDGKSMSVAKARKELAKRQQQAASAQSTLNKKSAELQNGWAQYYAGQQELEEKKAEGEQQIADGQAELKKAKKDIKKAKAEVKKKEPELEAAKEKVASLKKYEWSVSGRARNGGVVEASTLSGMTNRLSFSMAALFIIVGLLVSYSAVGRIVREQITQIGTKKALGLRGREITVSFLLYAAIAVLLGSVLGLVVGVFVVEAIIARSLATRFIFDMLPAYFDPALALLVTAIELVLVLGAAWLSCRTILKEHAVELLKGEKPPEGKTRFFEGWKVWQKLPLYTQTIVNNCLNDKKRVFSTVVGIAGCTALVVTAITLNNDVLKSYDIQYDSVYGFNAIAFVDGGVEGAADAVAQALEEDGHDSATVLRRTQSLRQPDGDLGVARILVPLDESKFLQLYHTNSLDGSQADLSADGVWVTQAYAAHLGASVGDEVTIEASDGSVRKIPIAGFYEFYLTNYEMVMGKACFQRYFEEEPVANAVLSDVGDASFDDLQASLANAKGFNQVVDDKTKQYGTFAAFSNLSRAVVLVYLVLAVLMAAVVLLNLNVMFIEEKKRELIVLMINGFSVKDAKRYIYNDTIVLTVIGIVVGLVLGAAMGSVTVGSMEPSTTLFFKGIDWPAIGIATAVSIVLSTVMSLIALRRIPAFKLTDINKA